MEGSDDFQWRNEKKGQEVKVSECHRKFDGVENHEVSNFIGQVFEVNGRITVGLSGCAQPSSSSVQS